MAAFFKHLKRSTVSAAGLLIASPAAAQDAISSSLPSDIITVLGAAALGLGLGAYLFRGTTKDNIEDSPKSRRYLAAIERISQGFTLFLRSPEKTTPDQALEWLLRETAKTLNVSRASLWFYEKDHAVLSLRHFFDVTRTDEDLFLSVNKHDHPAFFGTLRGERTVPFVNARDDIRCRDFMSILPEDDLPQSLLIALVGVGKQALGTLHITARQETREWSDSDRQFVGSIADLIAFYLSTRDLQMTQNALSEEERRFRDLVDASSDWYWETGPDHRFTYVSEKYTTYTGVKQEEVLGKTRFEFTGANLSEPKWKKHKKDLENHTAFRDFTYKTGTKDQNIFISVNGMPFFDEDGEFLGYRGTGADVTETMTYKNRFEEGINALPNGFIMWDADDVLVMRNSQIEKLFIGMEQYVDQHLTYIELLKLCEQEQVIKFPTPLNDEICQQMIHAHKACGIREIELMNGKHLMVHEHPTSEGGIVGIYTDITAIKARENELIESNELSEALSLSGNTLIHARNESFILSEICRIITEIGKFDCAWVSLFNKPGSLPEFIKIDMCKGLELELNTLKPSSTLKQLFIKQKQAILSQNILFQSFPDFKSAFEEASITVGAVFPIRIDTKVAGFLNVASQNNKAFNDRRMNLLEELANDIGYGLSSLRSEQSRLIAEEALRESEGRYRGLVDMSPDAILVLDENERIVFANPEGHAMFATKNRTEILNKRFSNYVCSDEDIFIRHQLPENEDPAQTFTSVELRRLDDTLFEADITTRPVAYAGLKTRLLIIRDVTERNRVNEHLAQTSKLATLGEMAAGITHELSQPLNIMRFAAEGSLLKMDREAITLDQIRKQFDLICLQSGRMADIIDHMRVFSRKDTGTVETFDPTLVVRQSVDMVEAQYLAEGIHMDIRYPDYYQKVKGRPIQLEQVVLNLITNAHDAIIQYHKKREDEWKETKIIQVAMTFDQAEHRINIAITDNGGGIPEEALPKLFDPFFTTKEVGKGTGLGLSVSYGIIAAMGGKISARNIHQGARFDITLPCASEEIEPTESLEPNIELDDLSEEDEDLDLEFDPDAFTVLVVDDEVYAAEAMMEYLFSHGFQVNMAGDGEEALELYDADPVDVVVTDIRMPRMDGHILIKQLKERNPNLPIIVVTGHTGMDDYDPDDLNRHAFTVMKKPVSLAELASQVEKAVNQFKEE